MQLGAFALIHLAIGLILKLTVQFLLPGAQLHVIGSIPYQRMPEDVSNFGQRSPDIRFHCQANLGRKVFIISQHNR